MNLRIFGKGILVTVLLFSFVFAQEYPTPYPMAIVKGIAKEAYPESIPAKLLGVWFVPGRAYVRARCGETLNGIEFSFRWPSKMEVSYKVGVTEQLPIDYAFDEVITCSSEKKGCSCSDYCFDMGVRCFIYDADALAEACEKEKCPPPYDWDFSLFVLFDECYHSGMRVFCKSNIGYPALELDTTRKKLGDIVCVLKGGKKNREYSLFPGIKLGEKYRVQVLRGVCDDGVGAGYIEVNEEVKVRIPEKIKISCPPFNASHHYWLGCRLYGYSMVMSVVQAKGWYAKFCHVPPGASPARGPTSTSRNLESYCKFWSPIFYVVKTCKSGERKCKGNELLICEDGQWTPYECEYTCKVVDGVPHCVDEEGNPVPPGRRDDRWDPDDEESEMWKEMWTMFQNMMFVFLFMGIVIAIMKAFMGMGGRRS